MIHCAFLPVFYSYHQNKKYGKALPQIDNFHEVENIWMSFYGLGSFETYQFLYGECSSEEHFQQWLFAKKGAKQVQESALAFEEWGKRKKGEAGEENNGNVVTGTVLLSEAQWQSWREQGYLVVSGLVSAHLCDAVTELICNHLGVHLADPDTWYGQHPDWHGLMLQLYQDESIHAIKMHPLVKQVFAELYATDQLIARTEKVSFNPPETETWHFAHSKLHWDVDTSKPDLYYIQGMVYLNDVPENRGPLQVVPGFQHRYHSWMQQYPDMEEAQLAMRNEMTAIPVPGKKGDIVLWQQTLPHAASANHSDVPRFVQYVSFSKL